MTTHRTQSHARLETRFETQIGGAADALPNAPRPTQLGPYQLVRPIAPAAIHRPASDSTYTVERWLALHTPDETDRIVHLFAEPLDDAELDRAHKALWRLAATPHAHLLSPECVAIHRQSRCLWAATRFVGHQERVLTLAEHARIKGGTLPPHETERAVIQLLECLQQLHAGGILSGPLHAQDILLDRRGSVCLELHGIGRALDGLHGFGSELVNDEVRSVVDIAYTLITGLHPEQTDGLRPSRLVRRLDRAWDQWFEAGLDPVSCFQSPEEAIEALPSGAFSTRPTTTGMIGRLRRALERPRPTPAQKTDTGAGSRTP